MNVALAQGPTAVLAKPERGPGRLESSAYRMAQWLRSPRPYLMLIRHPIQQNPQPVLAGPKLLEPIDNPVRVAD